jgi:hypothetical protein
MALGCQMEKEECYGQANASLCGGEDKFESPLLLTLPR